VRTGLCLIGMMAACSEVGFQSIDPDELPQSLVVAEERFVQQGLPAADILFVVDHTASMAQEQAALAAEFDALTGGLDVANIAWQLGVVTMAAQGDRAGWLQGDPWVVTSDSPDPEGDFARAVAVGTDGVGVEAGLAAALLALGLADEEGPNAGFRRPEAALHVVFVSDSDDESDVELGDDPVNTFLDRLAEERDRTGWPAAASAIVGPLPDGCVSDSGSALPAERYLEVVDRSGGASTSICAADFRGLLARVADVDVDLPTVFELADRVLDPTGMRVTVNGVASTRWTYQADPPAVVFTAGPAANAVITVSYLVSNQ
jgi:hypothetical protein